MRPARVLQIELGVLERGGSVAQVPPAFAGAEAFLAGLGGNFQHPCASTMVARAFDRGRRGTAIGTLNFAGDLGKMAAPALVY